MKKIISSIFIAMVSFTAFAENYGFLSNSAMSYFTKEDWEIFNKTQLNVLNKSKNGAKVSWKNPKSGSFGYMVPSSAARFQGMVCRNIFFVNTANQIKGEGSYKFCKSNN